MAKPKVKMNLPAVNMLMRSRPIQSALNARAERIAAAAGPGFEAVARPHKYTARAYVRTADEEGRKRQAESAVLERSLGAGG